MLQLIQTVGLPFIVCIMMSCVLGYLGIHVLKREVIFVDIALAQVAAVGVIISHLVFDVHENSVLSYVCSLAAIFVMAVFYTVARTIIVQISIEAVIGISYAIAAAAALFLVGIQPGGHVHIQHILSGSLLWTGGRDVVTGAIAFSAVGFCLYIIRKPLMSLSDTYRFTRSKGAGAIFWDLVFYLLVGLVITLSVQMGGIVLVFAYLIIPATISAVFASRLKTQLIIIWIAGISASIFGLLFAYYLDFSVGPAIALLLGIELIIAAAIGKLITI
jgi:zinc/manganese transport system permease protein